MSETNWISKITTRKQSLLQTIKSLIELYNSLESLTGKALNVFQKHDFKPAYDIADTCLSPITTKGGIFSFIKRPVIENTEETYSTSIKKLSELIEEIGQSSREANDHHFEKLDKNLLKDNKKLFTAIKKARDKMPEIIESAKTGGIFSKKAHNKVIKALEEISNDLAHAGVWAETMINKAHNRKF